MTKDQVKEFLDKLGIKVEELTDDLVAKVEDYKSTLDTETRRTVRKFWAVVSVIAFVAGVAVGHFLF